jgi:energy-coupling factor transporter ATP-binding protein EcfA2
MRGYVENKASSPPCRREKRLKMIKRLSTIFTALWLWRCLVEVCLLEKRLPSHPLLWLAWIGPIIIIGVRLSFFLPQPQEALRMISQSGPNINMQEKLLAATFMAGQERLLPNRTAHVSSGQVKQREQTNEVFFKSLCDVVQRSTEETSKSGEPHLLKGGSIVLNTPGPINPPGVKETNMSDAMGFDQFRAEMFSEGDLIRVTDHLNMKQSLMSGIYRETSTGFKLYNSFYNDSLSVLESYGITSLNLKEHYIKRLARDITIEGEINKNADYLVATPRGEVIDLLALGKIIRNGNDPEKYAEEWRKPIKMFTENRITLRTGVDYNPNITRDEGERVIEELIGMIISSPNPQVFQNTKYWFIMFLGRLLIGGNIWKEFVTFLGEKDSGKTTLATIIKDIMGSYAAVIEDEILQSKNTTSINRALYAIKDKRLLIHSEGTNQQKINTVTLKRITGGSPIPLGNQDFSFTLKGKIIEDTNYAPIPDNPDDDAFNERVIMIPFRKQTSLPKETVDKIIKRACDNKEAIFALMVHTAATINKNEVPTKLLCSLRLKHHIWVLRNLELAFYIQVCEETTDNFSILGRSLFELFHEWMKKCVYPFITALPYLSSERINYPTETEFCAKIKKIHRSYTSHSREGLRYTRLRAHKDRIYLDHDTLVSKENDPSLNLRRNVAKYVEEQRKTMESANTKECFKRELDASISKDIQRIQGVNENKPDRYGNIQAPMVPPSNSPFFQPYPYLDQMRPLPEPWI